VKSGMQKGGQEGSQGRNDQVRRVVRAGAEIQHGQKLGARIAGQPQPQHLWSAAQPGAQFVQLEVWEPEMAEAALVQGLCVLSSTGQKGW
jgi:hypothetical protein